MEETGSAEKSDWRNHGLRIIRSGELDSNTPQTPGMTRAEAHLASPSRCAKALGGNGGGAAQRQRPGLIIMGNWKP